MDAGVLIFILYSAWALYSGWKYVKQRGWCQGEGAGALVGRIAAAVGVGYVIGGWNIVKGVIWLGIHIAGGIF